MSAVMPSPWPAWHPSRVDLLLAEDGELPEPQLARTREHLRTCQDCRAVVGDIDDLAGAYRDTVDHLDLARLTRPAAAPVAPSESERSAAMPIDMPVEMPGLRSAAGRPADRWSRFQEKLVNAARDAQRQRLRMPARTSWLRFAAVLPLVLAFVLSGRFMPALRANELLGRAAQAEARDRAGVRVIATGLEIRIHRAAQTSGASMEDAGTADATGIDSTAAGATGLYASSAGADAALLTELGLDARDPLGISGFRDWRSRLGSKSDHVSETGERITITTTTDDGAIRQGTLRLDAATLQAIHLEWQLWNATRIEISRADALAPTLVRLLSPEKVQMAPRRAPAAMQSAMQAAVQAAVSAPVLVQRDTRPALLASWLDRQFADPAARQQFGATALQQARQLEARALAWQRLAARYPETARAQLSAADRATLHDLFASHRRQLAESLEALERHLAPVLSPVLSNDMSAGPAASNASNREPTTAPAPTARAQRIARIVFELVADVDAADAPASPGLSEAIRTLRGDLNSVRSWLTPPADDDQATPSR